MIKAVTISKQEMCNEKWTPKFAYIFKKLQTAANAIEFSDVILKGPINGIDARDFGNEGKNYVRISDMKRYFISYSDIKKVPLTSIPSKVKLCQNDILISRKGTPGISMIVTKNDLENVIGTEVILVRLKEEYDPYYVVAFLNSKIFYEQVLNNLSGAVASGINHPTLKKLKLIYDSRLASKVSSKVKKAIELYTDANDLITKSKELLYKGLNIDFDSMSNEVYFNVLLSEFKDYDLWTPKYSKPIYKKTSEKVKKKFKTSRLGDIANIINGDEIGSDNYNKFMDAHKTDVPIVRTSDIINHEVDIHADFYAPVEFYNSLKQDIKEGDILYTKDGKIGMVGMVTSSDKVIISSGVSRIRVNSKSSFTPEYIFTVLSIKETGKYPAIRRTVTASTIPHLREDYIRDFDIPEIDLSIMNEITSLVKNAFLLKNKRKQILSEVQHIIDEYFANKN